MGWETRGRGRYYYRKKRKGDQVVSEYVGTGLVAETIAKLDELDRRKLKYERRALFEEQAVDREIGRDIDRIGEIVRMMTRAALLASGYHTHKGQWRKRYVTK